MPKTKKQETGDIGEKIAGRFLVSKGFEIVGWNYRKPWGEIDIIVRKKEKIHFIEVKTVNLWGPSFFVSRETGYGYLKKCQVFIADKISQPEKAYDLHEISNEERGGLTDEYRPEDNLHPWKLKRLKRAIQSYLAEKRMSEEDDWQFDAVTVRLYEKEKVAEIEYLEDIIL